MRIVTYGELGNESTSQILIIHRKKKKNSSRHKVVVKSHMAIIQPRQDK